MPRTNTPVLTETVTNDYRKILAFASSALLERDAGPDDVGRISERDALEVIRSICLERLHGDGRAAAIVRFADRVRALVGRGVDPAAARREALEHDGCHHA